MRQLNAIYCSDSRAVLLKQIAYPTLVVHGSNDPLVLKECGIHTADNNSGSRLEVIDGMEHNLPCQLYTKLCELIIGNIMRSFIAEEV